MAFGEAFVWPCSLNFKCHHAKRFYALYGGIVVIAADIVLIPNLPLVRITLYVEAFNALVLPVVLGFLLVLSNDNEILGKRRNSLVASMIAGTISVVCVSLGLWYGTLTLLGQTG